MVCAAPLCYNICFDCQQLKRNSGSDSSNKNKGQTQPKDAAADFTQAEELNQPEVSIIIL